MGLGYSRWSCLSNEWAFECMSRHIVEIIMLVGCVILTLGLRFFILVLANSNPKYLYLKDVVKSRGYRIGESGFLLVCLLVFSLLLY